MDLDFGQEATDTSNSDFEPFPDGEYVLRLEEMTVEQGPKGPYFNCKFSVAPEHKRFVWDTFSCVDKPYPRQLLKDFLEALTEQSWDQPGMRVEPKELVGLMVNGILWTDSYYSPKKGKDVLQNKVSAYMPAEDIPDSFASPTQSTSEFAYVEEPF